MGVYEQHGFQILTRTGVRLYAEAEINYDFHFPFVYKRYDFNFPFVYNRYGANELPGINCVKKRYSYFRYNTDFSGYSFIIHLFYLRFYEKRGIRI